MAAEEDQPKKTRGKQKIEMKRIENEEERLITFSKRRSGIYKKASELVTLTGTEVAVVVFSPTGKPFSFAHPSVEHVANHFLGQEHQQNNVAHALVEAHRQIRINELNEHHNEMLRQLDMEKEKGKQLKKKTKELATKGWWSSPIEEMNMKELLQIETAFKDVHEQLIDKIKQRINGASSSSSQQTPHPMHLDPSHMTHPPFLAPDSNEGASYPLGFEYRRK